MTKAKTTQRSKCEKCKIATGMLAACAVLLIFISFFVPPKGIIDGSVLSAVGEIFAFAALFTAWGAIDANKKVSVDRKGTLSVGRTSKTK